MATKGPKSAPFVLYNTIYGSIRRSYICSDEGSGGIIFYLIVNFIVSVRLFLNRKTSRKILLRLNG